MNYDGFVFHRYGEVPEVGEVLVTTEPLVYTAAAQKITAVSQQGPAQKLRKNSLDRGLLSLPPLRQSSKLPPIRLSKLPPVALHRKAPAPVDISTVAADLSTGDGMLLLLYHLTGFYQ